MSKYEVDDKKEDQPEVVESGEPTPTYVGLGVRPDARYSSVLVAKFINIIMLDGRKFAATKVVYGALDIVKKKMPDQDPLEVLSTALENIKPMVEVKSKRVGGATYQIPQEVGAKRQWILAFRWIKESFRKKKGRPSAERLANEIIDAFNKQGSAISVRENTHKMAEANKAFAYYA